MTADLLTRAQAGDEEAFRQLVEPYRHPLQLHCYRILGSAHDAEDALQETLLSAWQGLGGFEERASVRTWLYRVATNCCLKVQRSRRRSQSVGRPAPLPDLPEPTRLGEVLWLDSIMPGGLTVNAWEARVLGLLGDHPNIAAGSEPLAVRRLRIVPPCWRHMRELRLD